MDRRAELYFDMILRLLLVILGGMLMIWAAYLCGCSRPSKPPIVQKREIPRVAAVPIQQWFVDLDQDAGTGYGQDGFDVLQLADGSWRQTEPPLYDGGWGPETDCSGTGARLLGRLETYQDGAYIVATSERRYVSCHQAGDLDADGDVDLRDAYLARTVADGLRVCKRMTGP